MSLPDRSHGSAYLNQFRGNARNRDLNRDENPAADRVWCGSGAKARSRRRDRDTDSAPVRPRTEECSWTIPRRGSGRSDAGLRTARRRWVVKAGAVAASVPAWTSRAGWLASVAAWAASDEGRRACAGGHVRAVLVDRVAAVMARYADGATGRHVAATNAVIAAAAGVSERTVTTVRGLLAGAGLAIEAHRGHGRPGAPSSHRPSVWHLISRREPVDSGAVCDLPPSLRDRWLCPVGSNSPSGAHARPRQANSTQKKPYKDRPPRPLRTQQLAAGVIARCVGLNRIHPGHVADALTRSGLDLETWTAPAIITALNTDMAATGWHWPEQIHNPGGFLRFRLGRLPERPGGPPRGRDEGAASPEKEEAASGPLDAALAGSGAPQLPARSVTASPEQRAAALAEIRAVLARPRTPPAPRRSSPPAPGRWRRHLDIPDRPAKNGQP